MIDYRRYTASRWLVRLSSTKKKKCFCRLQNLVSTTMERASHLYAKFKRKTDRCLACIVVQFKKMYIFEEEMLLKIDKETLATRFNDLERKADLTYAAVRCSACSVTKQRKMSHDVAKLTRN